MSSLSICRPCRRVLCQGVSRGLRSVSTQETSSTSNNNEGAPPPSTARPPSVPPTYLKPENVHTRNQENQLYKKYGLRPIGPRRRRAAVQTTTHLPFEQLPYQCFQEALKFLQTDRQEKLAEIATQRGRIQRLKDQTPRDEEAARLKTMRLRSLAQHLEYLKIQADINDPQVKRRFEDDQGDLNRPVYRHLAWRKWLSRRKLITEQRISQMHLVPDLLPSIKLSADVDLLYTGRHDREGKAIIPRTNTGRVRVMPGQFVASIISQLAPRLQIQVFEQGERLVTIAIVDPDVPNVEENSFDSRCNLLAVNVPISHVPATINLNSLADTQAILPWAPPYAQKGAPYHRIAVLIFDQPRTLDMAEASKRVEREGFVVRKFADRHGLRAIGAHLFRTQWDEWMQKVMRQAGIPGHDVEFKHKRVEPLPPKKRDGERFR